MIELKYYNVDGIESTYTTENVDALLEDLSSNNYNGPSEDCMLTSIKNIPITFEELMNIINNACMGMVHKQI